MGCYIQICWWRSVVKDKLPAQSFWTQDTLFDECFLLVRSWDLLRENPRIRPSAHFYESCEGWSCFVHILTIAQLSISIKSCKVSLGIPVELAFLLCYKMFAICTQTRFGYTRTVKQFSLSGSLTLWLPGSGYGSRHFVPKASHFIYMKKFC